MTTATLLLPRIYAPKVNWKILFGISFCAMAASLFFYVYQIYKMTNGYYLINKYENQMEQLLRENGDLEVNFAESSFLGSVLEKSRQMGFERTSSVQYIQIFDDSFAAASLK